MSRTAMRLGGAIGIAHVVLLLAGFSLSVSENALMETPDAGITAYFVDGPMTRIMTGGYIEVIGLLCFLPFAAALARVLRAHDTDSFAAPTALAAAVAYVTLSVSPGMAAGGAAVYLGHTGTTDVEVLRSLVALRTFSYFTSLMAWAVFFAAVAVAALVTRGQPRWVGLSAAVVAVALLAGVAAGHPDLPSFLGLIWMLAVSIRLLRSPAPTGTPAGTARSREAAAA